MNSEVMQKLQTIAAEIEHIAKTMSSSDVVAQMPKLTKSSGVCTNAWPSSEWRPSSMTVIEVTGKVNGHYATPRWFAENRIAEARKYLGSLDQGNAWTSKAWLVGDRVVTGKRVRLNLNHPHANYAYEL
jgi:hypothetical protein